MDPGQSVTLKRFDGYWGDKPEVENATYVWRNESAVRAAMVKTGEADIAASIGVKMPMIQKWISVILTQKLLDLGLIDKSSSKRH